MPETNSPSRHQSLEPRPGIQTTENACLVRTPAGATGVIASGISQVAVDGLLKKLQARIAEFDVKVPPANKLPNP